MAEEQNQPILKEVSGESSSSSSSQSVLCNICTETKQTDEIFTINHQFCTDRVSKHVTVTLKESPPAAGCPAGPDCKQILPNDDILCESLIPDWQKYHCPYNDCSVMLVNDGDEVVREAECPYCRRLFCAQCRVSWHCGFECEEFQRLNENERGKEVDLMAHQLAIDRRFWKMAGEPEELLFKGVSGESSSSSSPSVLCNICTETKQTVEIFTIPVCNHQLCTDCVSKHVTVTLKESPPTAGVIKCPAGEDCRATIKIDNCQQILPNDDILCESLIPEWQKYYCPFKDCSGMLVSDGDEVVREAECPHCRRLFCAQCRVSWHCGFECEAFQRLDENEREREDLIPSELAETQGSMLHIDRRFCKMAGEPNELVFKGFSGESSSSSSPSVLCNICTETKQTDEIFTIPVCNHQFCTDCVTKHVTITLKENPPTAGVIKCPAGPDCRATIDIDDCKQILPNEVITTWGDILCESLIPHWQKYYCPYKDCSGMLTNDDDEMVREAECPHCRRLFCAQCRVSWHCGVECEVYQRLNENERGKEDLMAHELAKSKQWQRCPKCRFYVEKTQGCLHIVCRCRHEFCYACGARWNSRHGGCRPR